MNKFNYPPCPSAYGGSLYTTRRARARARPLSTRHSMHLVVRSSQAKGHWSFLRPANRHKIYAILDKFSRRHRVKILDLANVGNHLHIHIEMGHRCGYKRFIRATASAIQRAITIGIKLARKFWDRRPFTRIVFTEQAKLRLKDYLLVNKLEGLGFNRAWAKKRIRILRL